MKKNVLKKILIIISISLNIILLSYLGYNAYMNMPLIKVDNSNGMLISYNNNLEIIANNLDQIMESDADAKWIRLNDKYEKNKEEKDKYGLAIPLSVAVRNYYFYATGTTYYEYDKEGYTNSNFLKYFKDSISKKNFNDLTKYIYPNYNYNQFENLFGITKEFEYTKEGYEEKLDYINQVVDYYNDIKNKKFKNYNEILENEYNKSEMFVKLSEYLLELQ